MFIEFLVLHRQRAVMLRLGLNSVLTIFLCYLSRD